MFLPSPEVPVLDSSCGEQHFRQSPAIPQTLEPGRQRATYEHMLSSESSFALGCCAVREVLKVFSAF